MLVSAAELRSLLMDEKTFDETLEKYFEIGNLSTELHFREGVAVQPDLEDAQRGIAASWVLKLVNKTLTQRRQRRYDQLVEEQPDLPRAVAEGDSWFLHPLQPDVVDQLSGGESPRLAIRSFAAAGDTLVTMWRLNAFLAAAEEEDARCILLSGGGNDVLGDEFPAFLNRWTPDNGAGPARLLNENFELKVSHLRDLYMTLAGDAAHRLPRAKLVVHGYDYVIPGVAKPDKDQFEHSGRWLGKHLTQAGIEFGPERAQLLRHIIDRFTSDVLAPLASSNDNVVHADTRNSVGSHEWSDEIHPNSAGFNAVALRILDAAKSAGALGG